MQPQFTPQQRREMIAKIRQLPAQLEVVVRDLTPVQLTTHYLANEWTIAQNVHHLADSHINSFVRLKLILTEDKPTLKPYNQDAWATRVDADNPSIETSLQLLRGLHARWSALLESLAESDWLRAGLHPEIGEITVEDLLRIYAGHGEGHIDQIQRTLAAAS